LLADAIKRAASVDSQGLRDALAKTAGFPGVTGQISFDANRNASKPGFIVTVKGGRFEIAEKIAP
jgi:branched-chain amino acid transport system substrate-binding protein